jgi:hypothetical protein
MKGVAMMKVRTDLATVLHLPRLEVLFQSDVVLVREGDTLRVAKHFKERPERNLPRIFTIESIAIEDGFVVTVIVPVDQSYYDGKDRIKKTY